MSLRFTTALVATFFAVTARAELKPVPTERLEDFKTAISQAVENSELNCVSVNGETVKTQVSKLNMNSGVARLVSSATEVQLDSSGNQPLLLVSYNLFYGSSRKQMLITTSADYKTIVKADARDMSKERINHGTLMNPDVREEYVTNVRLVCGSSVNAISTSLK